MIEQGRIPRKHYADDVTKVVYDQRRTTGLCMERKVRTDWLALKSKCCGVEQEIKYVGIEREQHYVCSCCGRRC